jgi:putative SOS response-associated peptidase YedK
MCNLYSLTKGQAAIRDWFRAKHDRTGNLPLFPGIFPDQMAPIARTGEDGERELVIARWGMPGPPQYGGAPVTNIRNLSSPHWRGWLGPQNRCLVPATSFCEYADTKPRKTPIWFALSKDRPLFAFAGLWASWRGVRGPKSAPVEGRHELFGFLTTDANAIVAPIHPRAMPVILTTAAEVDQWLAADTADALALQRPLPDEALRVVAKGEKEDRSPEFPASVGDQLPQGTRNLGGPESLFTREPGQGLSPSKFRRRGPPNSLHLYV